MVRFYFSPSAQQNTHITLNLMECLSRNVMGCRNILKVGRSRGQVRNGLRDGPNRLSYNNIVLCHCYKFFCILSANFIDTNTKEKIIPYHFKKKRKYQYNYFRVDYLIF